MITVLSESLLMPDSDVQFVCLISVRLMNVMTFVCLKPAHLYTIIDDV